MFRAKVEVHDDRVKIPPFGLELGPRYFSGMESEVGTHVLATVEEIERLQAVVEAAEAYIEVMSRPCVESARTRKLHDLINALDAAKEEGA